jgi:hypothetical protein
MRAVAAHVTTTAVIVRAFSMDPIARWSIPVATIQVGSSPPMFPMLRAAR